MLGSNRRIISMLRSMKSLRMMEVEDKRRYRNLSLLRSRSILELRRISLGHHLRMVGARGKVLAAHKSVPASVVAKQGLCRTETA